MLIRTVRTPASVSSAYRSSTAGPTIRFIFEPGKG
jgi:hypothetical protein